MECLSLMSGHQSNDRESSIDGSVGKLSSSRSRRTAHSNGTMVDLSSLVAKVSPVWYRTEGDVTEKERF